MYVNGEWWELGSWVGGSFGLLTVQVHSSLPGQYQHVIEILTHSYFNSYLLTD